MPSQNDHSQLPIIVSDRTELRRCIMHLWQNYNGLGLVLKYSKAQDPIYPQNLIKEVEIGSPAHYAGVLNNDLIIKVGQRLVETEKFDIVLKLIREQLKKEKKADLLLVNCEYYYEFRRKYENDSKQIDYNSPTILSQIKSYQSPVFNPNSTYTTSKTGTIQSSVLNFTPDSPPEPRLCHLLTWSNYDGYGFYVSYNKEGCFVKNVEPNSPAHLGGLRDYDRIIEINGKQIHHSKDKDAIMKLINKHKVKNSSTVKSMSSLTTTKSATSTQSSNTNYLDVFVADPNTYKFLTSRKVLLSPKNKMLKIQECFTPGEFTLLNIITQQASGDTLKGSTSTNSLNGHSSVKPEQDQLLRSIIIKKCKVRRLRGKEDQPLGFEMTKRGNNPNYISRVEPGSSAALSGLCVDDYLIELNENSIELDENSLLKEKIFNSLQPQNGGEFSFTTLNKPGFDYCIENRLRPSDYIKNNRQNIRCFETPIELSSSNQPPAPPPPPPQQQPLIQVQPVQTALITSALAAAVSQANSNPRSVPRLCVLNKTNENEELGISIARVRNLNEHIISDVQPGSLADKAGLKPTDCLLEVNGENVENKSHTETVKIIADLKKLPQARINLLVVEKPLLLSNNKTSASNPNLLDINKEDDANTYKSVVAVTSPNEEHKTLIKPSLTPVQNVEHKHQASPSINLYPEIKICEFLGYSKGTQLGLVITSDDYSHDVVKVAQDSPAFKAGLAKDDVIIAVNDQNVAGNSGSIELLNDFSEAKPLKILAASRYAYEWSKLLRIKITEKDWPNIKKFSTKHIPIPSPNTIQNQNQITRNNVTTTSNLNPDDNTRNIYYHQQRSYNLLEPASSTLRLKPNMNMNSRRVVSSASTIRSDQFSFLSSLSRSAVDITTDGKVLRMCTLIIDPTSPIPTDSEFGFDLVTKIGANQRIGDYYIDTVDMYSPACCSGLKPGDQLIEVDSIDITNKTFEQVVQLINEAKSKCKLKLLVYPSVVINYGNPDLMIKNQQSHNLTSTDLSRSMPDLSFNDFYFNKNQSTKGSGRHTSNDYDSIYYKKGVNFNTNVSKSSSNLLNTNYQIDNVNMSNKLRPVPRLCTIYKNDHQRHQFQVNPSNIGFGVQAKMTSSMIPNYMRVSIVNFKSPAYFSGLEAGDFIVEVNGRSTLTMSQEEALHFIKSSYDINNYVKLLVVSEFCFNWLKENDMLHTLNSEDRSVFSYTDYLRNNHRCVPKLCKIRLFPFSKSFGFGVESVPLSQASNENGKLMYQSYAHLIARVERESPAFSSSIQKGDRIIECDGVNVENETEQEINDRIYQAILNTKQMNLFVVDPDTDNFFKSRCIKLHSMLPIVQKITNSTDI